ncbi:LamG domain-containing protein [Aporhodopirellula aestuarii]|uniref:Glycosyl hydrolase n=1 Tax=Aporhodopirellula aestuarii TaxID=2950107 RepID=A0ABT0TXK9_9BACT|nr:glycosyl hydrolase [Aporhodopirellula aestuarii]MCM2369114.1 glycosyl hydrolase [Aporhodopirellula aestuarii]
MKFMSLLIFTCMLSTGMAQTQPFFAEGEDPRPVGKVWQQVDLLSDEFDGDSLDATKWDKNPASKHWGWIGRPPGLFQEESVVVEEGNLRVTVGVLDSPVVIKGNEFKYHGGIVRSVNPGTVGWYYECRMKANKTEMSSTFWLMPRPKDARRLEFDIQECVGRTTEQTASWGRNWDQIFHSNAIQHATKEGPEKIQIQSSVRTETPNWERYYVYGAWWKSPRELRFYLDGKYVYSLKPSVDWDVPSYYQMAIETYDWNPVPDDGGLVATATKEERTTQYDWIRTWRLE